MTAIRTITRLQDADDALTFAAAAGSNSGDLVLVADNDANGSGAILFKTGATERARITNASLLDLTNNGVINVGNITAKGQINIIGATDAGGASTAQPLLLFKDNTNDSLQYRWSIGLDTGVTPKNTDLFIGHNATDGSTTEDVMYFGTAGQANPTVSIGTSPASATDRLTINSQGNTTMACLRLQKGSSGGANTGDFLGLYDSANNKLLYVDTNGDLIGSAVLADNLLVKSGRTDNVGLTLSGLTSQTADILRVVQINQSAGLIVSPDGATNSKVTVTATAGGTVATISPVNNIIFQSLNPNAQTLIVRGHASQATGLIEFQTSASGYLGDIRWDGLARFTVKGIATLQKAGTPADGDWSAGAPPNGTIVGDSSGSKIWIRLGGSWKSVAVA